MLMARGADERRVHGALVDDLEGRGNHGKFGCTLIGLGQRTRALACPTSSCCFVRDKPVYTSGMAWRVQEKHAWPHEELGDGTTDPEEAKAHWRVGKMRRVRGAVSGSKHRKLASQNCDRTVRFQDRYTEGEILFFLRSGGTRGRVTLQNISE